MASDKNGARALQTPEAAAAVDELIHGLGPLRRPAAIAPALTPSMGTIGDRSRSRLRPIHPPMRAGFAWLCVGLGVLLGIALPYWPYARNCGWGLSFYLFAVSMVVVAGVWGQLITWKSHLGFAHTIALGTMLWGLTLTAQTVLPRVGYTRIPQNWTCPLMTGESG